MKILHSAIDTTGIDWDDTLPKMLKVFMTQQPQAKYRHDYRAPEYLISDIDLTFDRCRKTVVTAESKVSRHAAASDVPLRRTAKI